MERTRVSCLSRVTRSSRESIPTQTRKGSIKFNFPCLKFIMKKFKIFSAMKPVSQLVVLKSENPKVELYTCKDSRSTLLTLLRWSTKRWRMVTTPDLSALPSWTRHLVGLIRSLLLISNKSISKMAAKLKNSRSSTLSIWRVLKKLDKPVLQVTDWKRVVLLTRVWQSLEHASVSWLTKPLEKKKSLSFHTETRL